jgi:phospholipid/cholesterol/gamma-HCH transport system ATP-binding protein
MANLPAPTEPHDAAPAERKEVVEFRDVAIAFESNVVLDGISFALLPGETKVLLGVAGSGKSTILKLTLGLLKPDGGRIYVLGNEVTAMREEELFELRQRIGMVFQEGALFDSLTVGENVAYTLLEQGTPEEQARERVLEALRFVELEHTIDMLPSELSGGMRRRVAIARAIIPRPELLLYDSPTAGLDPVTSTTIIELVVKQRDVYHTSALLVTHRLQDAFIMATHRFDPAANRMRSVKDVNHTDVHTSFLILRDGKVLFDGGAAELVHSNDEYIREYLS